MSRPRWADRLSDYVSLDQKFFDDTRAVLVKMQDMAKELGTMELTETSLSTLLTFQREHTAMLSHFTNFYSPVSSFKENFEFLQAQRKRLKAEVMDKLRQEGMNHTNAEREVYGDNRYIEAVKDLEGIKMFFIAVAETYDLHKDIISRNIFQNVSIKQKQVEREERAQ